VGKDVVPVRRRGAAALLSLVALAACSPSGSDPAAPRASGSTATAAPPATPPATSRPSSGAAVPTSLHWTPCEAGFECAALPVPLVEDDPAQGSVTLALTRRRATGQRTATIGSLVVNPGGPGASAVDFLQSAWSAIPEPVRERFDLVAFDPRGVGRSSPVRCADTAELDRLFALDPSPDDPAELAALEQGSEQLAAGCARRSAALLPHVSTAHAAEDLDRVRAAVGDERLSYLGYSYGTVLGAAHLERFPTRVRAMVLDGGVDPSLSWDELLAGQARGFEGAFSAFLADCERTRCAFRRQVSGDLGAAYDALTARVEGAPLPGTAGRTVGPGELWTAVLAGLYSPSQGWPALAAALAAGVRGDGSALLALRDAYLDRGPEGYSNVSEANLAVHCLDRPWPRTTPPYLALSRRLTADAPRFGPPLALSGLACASWPVAAGEVPWSVEGEGAPPIVVVGTTGDPATPYAWSVALAEQLASGVLLTWRGEGHTVYRSSGPPCVVGQLDAYLLRLRLPGTTTC
jgi:pimeloyl-ACP methyl ester carboxylesterase